MRFKILSFFICVVALIVGCEKNNPPAAPVTTSTSPQPTELNTASEVDIRSFVSKLIPEGWELTNYQYLGNGGYFVVHYYLSNPQDGKTFDGELMQQKGSLQSSTSPSSNTFTAGGLNFSMRGSTTCQVSITANEEPYTLTVYGYPGQPRSSTYRNCREHLTDVLEENGEREFPLSSRLDELETTIKNTSQLNGCTLTLFSRRFDVAEEGIKEGIGWHLDCSGNRGTLNIAYDPDGSGSGGECCRAYTTTPDDILNVVTSVGAYEICTPTEIVSSESRHLSGRFDGGILHLSISLPSTFSLFADFEQFLGFLRTINFGENVSPEYDNCEPPMID